jgi:hypothetical protein
VAIEKLNYRHMKKNNIYIGICLLLIMVTSACSLDEEPKFIGADVLYQNTENSKTALYGVYSGMSAYHYYGSTFMHVTNYASGMINGPRQQDLDGSIALNPQPTDNDINKTWKEIYNAIGKANDFITNMRVTDMSNKEAQNDQLGQALFLRALSYFNLVRMWGEVPLVLKTATSNELNFPKAPKADIIDQIIEDLDEAATLMKGDDASDFQEGGRPSKFTANMVLAQVYMYLAGNQTAAETDYWQKAYDEAIKVYGRYRLVNDFRSLWFDATSNFSSEAIFELQGNIENTFRFIQTHTPNGGIQANTWGRFRANLEVYTQHANAYGGQDPRYLFTYITEYVDKNGKTQKTYSTTNTGISRTNNLKAFPWTYKYWGKEAEATTYNTNRNFVVLRYAHVLLMLAEIENELRGPEGAYTYINEVLARARQSTDTPSGEPADWSGLTQEAFREAIMKEYTYELFTEGHEFFYNRRRGIEFFEANVIEEHNSFPDYDFTKKYDKYFPEPGTVEAQRVLLLPIPNDELIGNPNVSEQNPGYN